MPKTTNDSLTELFDAILNYATNGWPRLHELVPGQIRGIGHCERCLSRMTKSSNFSLTKSIKFTRHRSFNWLGYTVK